MPATPSYNIEILESHLAWKTLDTDYHALINTAVKQTLLHTPLPPLVNGKLLEISIVLSSDSMIATLNMQYKEKEGPTNVLSFSSLDGEIPELPAESEEFMLGDIVLALETIRREASEQDKSFEAHLSHLTVHGLLHLLGYDHENDKDAHEMESLEIKILHTMDIENPYESY